MGRAQGRAGERGQRPGGVWGRHLVAGVHAADFADVQVVQGHEQLGPQRAVVHVARAQEQRPQELQHHVVQLHAPAHHARQRLHHLHGPAPASRRLRRRTAPATQRQLAGTARTPAVRPPCSGPLRVDSGRGGWWRFWFLREWSLSQSHSFSAGLRACDPRLHQYPGRSGHCPCSRLTQGNSGPVTDPTGVLESPRRGLSNRPHETR